MSAFDALRRARALPAQDSAGAHKATCRPLHTAARPDAQRASLHAAQPATESPSHAQ